MESVETIIPDNEGNHLVVVLSFYDDNDKVGTFQIPQEFDELDIVDIAINKLYIDTPLNLCAFFKMCRWLIEQFTIFPNAVFSFICSTDPLETHHENMASEQYRWNLFEYFYRRNIPKLTAMGIESKDIIVGPEGYQTFSRVFYRISHAPIINIVIEHLSNKYSF